MSLFNGLPDGYIKTSIETRYNQDKDKLGPVLSPKMSSQWNGDDGQTHLIEILCCTYGVLMAVDGDCWESADSSSINRFLA